MLEGLKVNDIVYRLALKTYLGKKEAEFNGSHHEGPNAAADYSLFMWIGQMVLTSFVLCCLL